MSYVTMRGMLESAKSKGYAVAAFNVENMEMMQGVIAAAEELNSPVILQTTPGTVNYGGLKYFYHIALAAAMDSPVPIALHLDHGISYEMIIQSLRIGYSSIMIDGSALSFAENVTLTNKVIEICRPNGIPVEAELGRISGSEDGLESDESILTDPEEAAEFVKQTTVDYLAVAIGTEHGLYKSEPNIDFDRLEQIKKKVSIPLVLHGATGIPDKDIMKCVDGGICKINYATVLRIAFSNGVRQAIAENPQADDPKIYMKSGRDSVKRAVMDMIKICGCADKA